tara:strand:- start:268 stop:471 length:204 start_codon:yes stop_codon:yes gene_type:complete
MVSFHGSLPRPVTLKAEEILKLNIVPVYGKLFELRRPIRNEVMLFTFLEVPDPLVVIEDPFMVADVI